MNGMAMNNIKKYRKKAGLTQEELAKKMGVSKSFVCLKENGKRGISIEDAKLFSKALKVPIEKIFFT